MNRKNNHRMTGTGLTCMLAFLFAFIFVSGCTVYAQQKHSDVILPIIQKFTVKNAQQDFSDKQGTYELVSLDTDSPMPEGSTSGRYRFTLDGSEEQNLCMTYENAGVYQYRLRQTTEEADGYHYDRNSYTISVYVENGKNGQMTTQVIAENEQKEKCENLRFENSYTGDTSETQTPGSQSPTENRNSVKTGDTAPLAVWIWMLILSAGGMAVVFSQKRRAQSEK